MHKENYYKLGNDRTIFSAGEAIRDLRLNYEICQNENPSGTPWLLRFFCSDVHQYAPLIHAAWADCPGQIVCIGQTPLDSAFVSLQIYSASGEKSRSMCDNHSVSIEHGGYHSLWSVDVPTCGVRCAATQSQMVLLSLIGRLENYQMTLTSNLVRTWYYVRDVDNNYAGMIKARTACYEAHGLTPDAHFIASTGIEGSAPAPHALVWLHSHAIKGLQPEQITYLKALEHLSPTHIYGVNFERATRITYGDRIHVHISGTASIDKYGNVLYAGNVIAQFERAVANVAALLEEGGLTLEDLRAAIIYLRDPHDYRQIQPLIRKLLPPQCAVNVNHAPVCRPDWLVEIEGEAIAYKSDSRFPNFI